MTVGDVFGRLTVVELIPGTIKSPAARVRCDCGQEKVVLRGNLSSGRTRSCGCLTRELSAARLLVHGAARHPQSPEYVAWLCAKQRVTNPNDKGWRYYGGRGVTMCQEWLDSFAAFLAHIGPKPDPSLTLDRIDNERGYEPGNVRWATWSQQNSNKRRMAAR